MARMKLYGVYENGHRFAVVEAMTAVAALNKAEREFPRYAVDYNGYVGPVTWYAEQVGNDRDRASKTVHVTRGRLSNKDLSRLREEYKES